MPHLRNILHPGHVAKYIYRRTSALLYRRVLGSQFRSIRRGQRDRCWCDGQLLPFKWHQSYGVCAECGCYVNRCPPLPEELKRFYSLNGYWGPWMRLKGCPTINNRTEADLRDGRVDCWLSLIGRYGPSTGQVVEVGCGHAVLLRELHKRGYDCIGVEISEDVSEWGRRHTGLRIMTGAFPHVELPECNMFLAFDVLEHVHNPVAFLQKIDDLLKPGGIAILQQPTVRPEQGYNLEPPLGDDFERMFDDLEHLWIFTSASLRMLAELTDMQILDDKSRWRQCHEITVLKRRVEDHQRV